MDLIIKPTERCNFKCTFCSSTTIANGSNQVLDLGLVKQFLTRFPATKTIIVNGGDPLMVSPSYYMELCDYLDKHYPDVVVSLTTNLWKFVEHPLRWLPVFTRNNVQLITSFQFGEGRLMGDGSLFTQERFMEAWQKVVDYVGERIDFISVLTYENHQYAYRNVKLAKKLGVECKLNYAMASGAPVVRNGITMGHHDRTFVLADAYEYYVGIHERGLAQWEYNTKQMVAALRREPTTCPIRRDCDSGIRTLQPTGDYYSCGSFGDDKAYPIDFKTEMEGELQHPLDRFELLSLKSACFSCPMFELCNGCKKTISDLKRLKLVETHCKKMKDLAPRILVCAGVEAEVPPYEAELIEVVEL